MLFVRLILAGLLLGSVFTRTTPAVAQSNDIFMPQLAAYFQKTFGSTAADTAQLTKITAAYTTTCPVGRRCSFDGAYLVTYSDGDTTGQALMFVTSQCPSCLSVAMAGGGPLDAAGMEALGLTSDEVYTLQSNQNLR